MPLCFESSRSRSSLYDTSENQYVYNQQSAVETVLTSNQIWESFSIFFFADFSCPYGPVAMIPGALAFAAWVLTYTFGFSCHMIDTRLSPNHTATLGFGPWSVQYSDAEGVYTTTGGTGIDDGYPISLNDDRWDNNNNNGASTFVDSIICVTYNNWYAGIDWADAFDAKARTAQAFSMIAIVLSLPLVIVASLPCCCPIGKHLFLVLGIFSVFTAFSSLMTLVRNYKLRVGTWSELRGAPL